MKQKTKRRVCFAKHMHLWALLWVFHKANLKDVEPILEKDVILFICLSQGMLV